MDLASGRVRKNTGDKPAAAANANAAVTLGDISPTQSYQIVERGQDFAVHRRVVTETDSLGNVQVRTHEFTTLDHGLHYFEAERWKESQDLLESFPEGAIARFGAYKTILANDLSATAAFDINGPDGQRIRGGPRTIQLTDIASGKSLILGEVTSTIGQIIPPNRVIYTSAFGLGLEADVLYVWRHNSFSQNIIVKQTFADEHVEKRKWIDP